MSQPSTAPGETRNWPPRRPTRSQTCQPSKRQGSVQPRRAVFRRLARRLRSSARPRRIPTRRGRGGVFFRVQQQAARDILRLEGFKDRPDVQKRVDASGVTGTALPASSPTPSQSSTARRATDLAMTSASSSWLASSAAPPARHQRARTPSARWSAARPAGAGRGRGPAIAAWRSGSGGSSVVSTSLIRVAVHMRAGLAARAACQSNVACTPCGPDISMRGRGR